jgi:hypothetical protein
MKSDFTRFVGTVGIDKRIVSVTVSLNAAGFTGAVFFTDLQFQEGSNLSGYVLNNNYLGTLSNNIRHWHNGILRSGDTVVVFNVGETSAPLDCCIYPNQNMSAGSVELSQGCGSHKCVFTESVNAGDELKLLAESRLCLRNGASTNKKGFYQYSAAWDSKHPVKIETGKSARLCFEYVERRERGIKS